MSDLLNRDADQAKPPSPDLEPIRKLIEVATDCEPVSVAGTSMMGCPQGKLVGCVDAARDALPALKSLLAEVERLREENGAFIHRNTQLITEKKIAVEVEREACAQIAIGHQISETSLCAQWGRECAAAIRRRD